ncbi:flavin-containing monooxygenase [Corynebacterium suicordis]|nr:NAD(P)/FAD-dependent oxidoreductase [Corynebacterium suicordis]MDR6278443.1 monooxygenase [Corynebacterium suicordis]
MHTTTYGSQLKLEDNSSDKPFDLIIVGAGISGVDLAHHVHERLPEWEWMAVDSNTDVGGTWNTFTYPGIRSDSDMATFAFPFKPWPHSGSLGSAADIRNYVREVAQDAGFLDRLLLSTWVQEAEFHTESGLWSVRMQSGPAGEAMAEGGEDGVEKKERVIWTKRIHFAAGYFRHSHGFTASIPGIENFQGTVIHPQRWPKDLDVRSKKVVVIGSGATSITLLPALHNMGAEATMLQRTPTYIAPLLETDWISACSRAVLPDKYSDKVARAIHVRRDMAQYYLCQKYPTLAKGVFHYWARKYLPAEQVKQHFKPPYNPWDQRVCKAPDGDIYQSIANGAQVVTGNIEEVQERGIKLQDGRFIEADVIVTATGLVLQGFGNAQVAVDGQHLPMPDMVSYRGLMLDSLPNFSYTIGYLNQSWTLRADMTSDYMVTLWKQLGEDHYCPVLPDEVDGTKPLLDMDAGYIKRSVHLLPRQGDRDPWRLTQDFLYESKRIKPSDNKRDMVFGRDAIAAAQELKEQAAADAARSTDSAEPAGSEKTSPAAV